MIWGEILATCGAAALAGGLAVPAGRRLLLGDVRHDWLQDQLDLDRIGADGVTVHDRRRGLHRAWILRGVSYDAKVIAEQEALLAGRTALIHALAGKGLTLRLFAVKRLRDVAGDAHWPNAVLAEIGAREAEAFRRSYSVAWYLVASGKAPVVLDEAAQLVASMAGVHGALPVEAAEGADRDCALTGFLNGLVCGAYRRDLPRVSRDLSGCLPASDLRIERATGTIHSFTPEHRLQRIVTAARYPEAVSGRLLRDLLALPGEVEICQICEPVSRERAAALYKRRQQAARAALLGNPAAAAEIAAALSMVAEDTSSFFATQLQIAVRADGAAALDTLVAAVCEVLGAARVAFKVQTAGAAACWFARLPSPAHGKMMPGARLMAPLDLRDANIAALWAFPRAAGGLSRSQFGDQPVRRFQTTSGASYAFQFQATAEPNALGNFLVFAPSGAGKSTLIMHLLGGLAKFEGIRAFVFDSKEGARFMVEALGGLYQGYDGLALNPLDVGSDTPANRQRVAGMLRVLAGELALDPEDEQGLAHAVTVLFGQNEAITLNDLVPFAFARRSRLRRAMAKWIVDDKGNKGLHAHVFTAPRDSLADVFRRSRLIGINMNEALGNPVLGPPVVAHISQAIGRSAAASARGFVIFIDEAAQLLRNPGFRSLAAEMFREYRKLGGAVGLAFQDPAALLGDAAASAFIENTATFIFFPNPQVASADLAAFHLNEEQIGFVRGRTAGRGRPVLIVKRDAARGLDDSAIVDADLTPLGAALRFYDSGPAANTRAAALRKQWGTEWRAHL